MSDDHYDDLLFGRRKRSTMLAIGRWLVLANVLALILFAALAVRYG